MSPPDQVSATTASTFSDDDAMLRLTAEGELAWINPAGARLFGYESVERFMETARQGNREAPPLEALQALSWCVLENGDVVVVERVLQRQSGARFPCRCVLAPWYRNGRPAGVQILLEDRTSRSEVQSFLGTIMDALPTPVFVKDSAHRWIALNDAYCELMGCDREARLGKSDFDFHNQEEAELYWKRDDLVLSTGVTDESEEPWTDRSGRRHIVITRKSRHIVAGQPFLVGVLTDVTFRKEAEESLRRSHLQMEQRVLERTAALTGANEELQRIHRKRDEFISALSHELRNPLGAIANSLQLLLRNTGLDVRGRASVQVIERQVRQLTRLVSDLLDVSRVVHGKTQIRRARVELGGLVRRTLEDYRAALADHLLELEISDVPVWVDGDETRLVQIIGNLLDNAAKFTPRGKHVSVSLGLDGDGALLQVSDEGVGIEPEMLPLLFEPFMQADRSLDRSHGGLGLGLALVKGLAELHGGRIGVESAGAGQGATFKLRLPLAEPGPEARPTPSVAADARVGRLRVLVVEDNRDAAESMSELLELEGHEVAVAYDGNSGLAKARAFRPDVILCDIGLPGMNGYEVARALRQEPDGGKPLLVAMTGYVQPEDERHAREAGFDRHLAKPVQLPLLHEILSAAGTAAARVGELLH